MPTAKAILKMVTAWNRMTGKEFKRVGAEILDGPNAGVMFYLQHDDKAVIELPKETEVTVWFHQEGEYCRIIDAAQTLNGGALTQRQLAADDMYEALQRFIEFDIKPQLSDADLSVMACNPQFAPPRNDKARIGYIGKTPFRDNAHALKQLNEFVRGIIAKTDKNE